MRLTVLAHSRYTIAVTDAALLLSLWLLELLSSLALLQSAGPQPCLEIMCTPDCLARDSAMRESMSFKKVCLV